MRIFSKPFFTNYIVHPLSKDLTRGDRAKALISSIAIGILTLGVCQAVCAVKFHNRRTEQYTSKVIVYCPRGEYDESTARDFLKRLCPQDYRLEIEFTNDFNKAQGSNQRVLGVFTFTGAATEQEIMESGLGYATTPGEHRKTMVLVNSTCADKPNLRGQGWEHFTGEDYGDPLAKNRIIAFLDSDIDDDIRAFFAPFPKKVPEERYEAL